MKSKKILSSILAFTLAFGVCTAVPADSDNSAGMAIVASAAEHYKTVKGFVLNKDSDGNIYVSDYTGKGGNITIPKEATYVGEKAFEDDTSITSVTFPAGTTKYGIGIDAFARCTNLTSVTINGNVGSGDENGICAGAFSDCYSLKTVKFSKSKAHVSFIGEEAFFSCYSLTSINLPSDTGTIYDSAFENCLKLSKIKIPKKTVIDGSYAFGYMFGCNSAEDFHDFWYNETTNKLYDVKADGRKSVYWKLYVETEKDAIKMSKKIFGSDNWSAYGEVDDNGEFVPYDYSFCYPIKQCVITLQVASGSPAEKWAKQHKIKYVSSNGTSSSTQLDAPANLDATKTKNSVTLVWDEVTDASAYRIYKYDAKTKKYKKYRDVTSPMCKVTKLSSKTKYKFKVVGLKKSGDSYKEGEYATISVTTK